MSGDGLVSNSDPITGQAGWYDVRVRIRKADPHEEQQTAPQFAPVKTFPGMSTARKLWLAYTARSTGNSR
jgi:hypothetical protein